MHRVRACVLLLAVAATAGARVTLPAGVESAAERKAGPGAPYWGQNNANSQQTGRAAVPGVTPDRNAKLVNLCTAPLGAASAAAVIGQVLVGADNMAYAFQAGNTLTCITPAVYNGTCQVLYVVDGSAPSFLTFPMGANTLSADGSVMAVAWGTPAPGYLQSYAAMNAHTGNGAWSVGYGGFYTNGMFVADDAGRMWTAVGQNGNGTMYACDGSGNPTRLLELPWLVVRSDYQIAACVSDPLGAPAGSPAFAIIAAQSYGYVQMWVVDSRGALLWPNSPPWQAGDGAHDPRDTPTCLPTAAVDDGGGSASASAPLTRAIFDASNSAVWYVSLNPGAQEGWSSWVNAFDAATGNLLSQTLMPNGGIVGAVLSAAVESSPALLVTQMPWGTLAAYSVSGAQAWAYTDASCPVPAALHGQTTRVRATNSTSLFGDSQNRAYHAWAQTYQLVGSGQQGLWVALSVVDMSSGQELACWGDDWGIGADATSVGYGSMSPGVANTIWYSPDNSRTIALLGTTDALQRTAGVP